MKEQVLWVALGGALGSVARYACSGWVARLFGETFPWGTLFVNVAGSLLIGFGATVTGPDGRWLASPATRQFLLVGFCGGYTTFSTFSLQNLALLNDGDWGRASANMAGSVVACMVGVWLGAVLGNLINSGRIH